MDASFRFFKYLNWFSRQKSIDDCQPTEEEVNGKINDVTSGQEKDFAISIDRSLKKIIQQKKGIIIDLILIGFCRI
jgi:hypothetical protein